MPFRVRTTRPSTVPGSERNEIHTCSIHPGFCSRMSTTPPSSDELAMDAPTMLANRTSRVTRISPVSRSRSMITSSASPWSRSPTQMASNGVRITDSAIDRGRFSSTKNRTQATSMPTSASRAAYTRAAATSSRSKNGYSSISSSGELPVAIASTTTYTGNRVPRTHGWPSIKSGCTTIRSASSILGLYHSTGDRLLRHPSRTRTRTCFSTPGAASLLS